MLNKKDLTEADIRTKFITPAILGPNGSKWNVMTQVLEERYFTKGLHYRARQNKATSSHPSKN